MVSRQTLARLSFSITLLVFGLLLLGAYLRLVDAGLGCDGWPACYAQAELPPLPGGAGGLYALALVGAGILAWLTAFLAWQRRFLPGQPRRTPLPGMIYAVFHILLVSAGAAWLPDQAYRLSLSASSLLLLLLLWWQALRYGGWLLHGGWYARSQGPADSLRPWAVLIFLLMLAQNALGMWVGIAQAGLSCIGFSHCLAAWPTEFSPARLLLPASPEELEQSRTVLFLLHRAGAVVVLLALIGLILHILFNLRRCPALRQVAWLLLLLMPLQMALGMNSLLLGLPPWGVLSHLGAAILLVGGVVTILHLLWPSRSRL